MKLAAATLLGVLSLVAVSAGKNGSRRPDQKLVVHEWGTFTSVAGPTGEPVPWAPLAGPPDLPCFVQQLNGNFKTGLMGRVRMETPVIYFYTPRPETVSVHVKFPRGWITEWYPKATRHDRTQMDWGADGPVFKNGAIDWDGIQLLPGADLAFPSSKGSSHYFAARQTDAAPLRIGDQQEKMLFYRGIANFDIPLRVKFLSSGELELRNAGPDPLPAAVVFDNQDGRTGYRIVRDIRDTVTVPPPDLTAGTAAVEQALAAELQSLGLYQREAQAMIATWRDSWFEEGMRVFYLMPLAAVDRVLPLAVTPAPTGIARVFVGRVEVLSPAVRAAIETAAKAKNAGALTKYGRFLEPFARRLALGDRTLVDRVGAAIQRGFSPGACVE